MEVRVVRNSTVPYRGRPCAAAPSPCTEARRGLGQFAGKQAEHHRVAPRPLKRDVRAEHALARKPAALGNPLRGTVVRAARELQPGKVQILKGPARDEPYGVRGDAAPTCMRPQPVADPRAALCQVNVIE